MNLYETTGGGKKMTGGSIRMPSEYFGVNSGRYQMDSNMGRSHNSYGYMNGGLRKKSKRSKRSRSRNFRGGSPASNRVMSFVNSKQGGSIRMPSEYFGVNSGRYQMDANMGRSPNSYGYMNGGFVRDGSIQHFKNVYGNRT